MDTCLAFNLRNLLASHFKKNVTPESDRVNDEERSVRVKKYFIPSIYGTSDTKYSSGSNMLQPVYK